MMVEVVRMVAAALEDPTTGVNALIPALVMDSGDQRPPAIADFKNVADDDLGVRESDFPTPFILCDVRSDSTMQGYAMSGVRDGTVVVTVAYITKGGTTAQNFRDTDYTLRAIARSLHAKLWAGTGSDAARTRNLVAIKNSPTMTLQAVKQEAWGGIMTGIAALTFNVRDLAP